MTRHKHAMILGKFYPPHIGHHSLIRYAAAQSEQVTVIVMAASNETITLNNRLDWLRQEHANEPTVTFVGIPDDIPINYDDIIIWNAHEALLRAVLPAEIDAVFTSESYGTELARRFNATHVMFDKSRTIYPVSGTSCRNDIAAQWDFLATATRSGMTTRAIFVGGESTGTTTASKAVTEHYRQRGGVWGRTEWVPEHGRDYTIRMLNETRAKASALGLPEPGMESLHWTSEDFTKIAKQQTIMENKAACNGSPLLTCDTDAFATLLWERRYLGESSQESYKYAHELLPPRDIYFLTDHKGVMFEQDGIRDGKHVRQEMTQWFSQALTDAGHSWVLLTGSPEQRKGLAVKTLDAILLRKMCFGNSAGS